MKNFIILLLVFCSSVEQITAQPTLFGLTGAGGNQFGTIYSITTGSNSLSSLYKLEGNEGSGPDFLFTQASSGKIFGVTNSGGAYNEGTLFEYDTVNKKVIKMVDFEIVNVGKWPSSKLIEATNGKLYGTTFKGGVFSEGTLYEYDILLNVIQKKKDFGGLDGDNPNSVIQATNGKFYGTAEQGGLSGGGVLFEYDLTTNAYIVKYNFSSANSNGFNPIQIIKANNGKIYGVTRTGGAGNLGTLFEYDITTNVLVKKADFLGVSTGSQPKYLMQASNNKIYGTTFAGGAAGLGVIFEYDIATNVFVKKVDFNSVINDGQGPLSLEESSGSKFIGVAGYGGVNNDGVIFEYDFSSNVFTKKIDFIKKDGSGPARLIKLSNGKYYGTTAIGGKVNLGVLYEYIPTSNTYSSVVHFGISEGCEPFATSLTKVANGKLYGLTFAGGNKNIGTVFEYDPVSKVYVKKIDLDTLSGFHPEGSLTLASNGKLYGVTKSGGTLGVGVLFEYDYISNTYTKKYDFGSGGYEPNGKLVQALNGKLYGMCYQGGMWLQGAIFEYDIASNTYTKKIDLSSNIGQYPYNSIIQANNGKLYGLCFSGGVNNKGVIFEYNPTTNTYVKFFDFNGSNGEYPFSSLMQASNGKLYGIASGGSFSSGVLFEIDPTTYTYTKKYDFLGGTNGSIPSGILVESLNGKIYGTTAAGGNSDKGIVFEYDLTTNVFAKKLDFNFINGVNNGNNYLVELCKVPNVIGPIFAPSIICNGASTVQISHPNLTGATNYTWSLPSGSAVLSGAGTNSIVADFTSLAIGVYTLGVIGGNICGSSPLVLHTFTINANPQPTLNIVGSSSLICTGQTATITTSGANTYTWSTSAIGNSIVVSPTTTTTYSVVGTDLNGCQNNAIITLSVSLCTGINELSTKEISVYPNPTTDELVIESSYIGNLVISDISGRIVYEKLLETKRTKINFKNYAEGIYYLKIANKEKINVVKVVKE